MVKMMMEEITSDREGEEGKKKKNLTRRLQSQSCSQIKIGSQHEILSCTPHQPGIPRSLNCFITNYCNSL